jgi:hypothetical protein
MLFTRPPPSRRLIEHRAAALRGVEFLGTARTADEVRVVERVDHVHAAIRTAHDQRARAQDRRVERMAVADDEVHVHALRRVDHRRTVLERQRHRLFDEQVLAVPRRKNGMRRVILMRGRHIDDLDRRIGAQFFNRLVRPGGEIRRKTRPRLRARIGGRDQRDARVLGECRQHHGECTAKPRDTQTQLALLPAHVSPTSTACRIFIRVILDI